MSEGVTLARTAECGFVTPLRLRRCDLCGAPRGQFVWATSGDLVCRVCTDVALLVALRAKKAAGPA